MHSGDEAPKQQKQTPPPYTNFFSSHSSLVPLLENFGLSPPARVDFQQSDLGPGEYFFGFGGGDEAMLIYQPVPDGSSNVVLARSPQDSSLRPLLKKLGLSPTAGSWIHYVQ